MEAIKSVLTIMGVLIAFLIMSLSLALLSKDARASTKCENVAIIAEATMEIRQSGADMSEVYSKTTKFNQVMLRKAYDRQYYNTDKYKNKAIRKFKNKMFLWCLNMDGGSIKL